MTVEAGAPRRSRIEASLAFVSGSVAVSLLLWQATQGGGSPRPATGAADPTPAVAAIPAVTSAPSAARAPTAAAPNRPPAAAPTRRPAPRLRTRAS